MRSRRARQSSTIGQREDQRGLARTASQLADSYRLVGLMGEFLAYSHSPYSLIYPHPHAPAIYPEPSTLNPKPSTVTQVLGPEVLAVFIVVDMQKPSGLLASIACALAKELD